MSEVHRNSSGNPYSTSSWLDNHHSIKSRLRAELIHKLPIYPGSKILDFGCGTGLWSILLAERVGHKGLVVGVDQDHESIAIAQKRIATHYLRNNIRFVCANALELKSSIEFDLVIAFNTLSYIPEPRRVLDVIPLYLSTNGTVLFKDSDIGSDFFWPIDLGVYNQIMQSVNRTSGFSSSGYDMVFARKLPGLLTECNYSIIQVISQSHSFIYPVDQYERRYIAANGRLVSDIALQSGDKEIAKMWISQFEDHNKSCIFNNPEFLYSMTEFLFHARPLASS